MGDMSSDDEPSAEQAPGPAPRGGRGRRIAVAVTAATVVLFLGGAVATATVADDGPSAAGPSSDGEHHGRRQHRGRGHDHAAPARPPYAGRYAGATPGEQAAADALVADVRATLAGYADLDAAVAAGYQPPQRQRPREHDKLQHYVHLGRAADGRSLDPTLPEGLVYATAPGGEGDPVLVGAFFVVRPGEPAPQPAGDLVVWHSHDSQCPELFTSDTEPCLDTRRMLHVWTADQVTLAARRSGQPSTVRVTDPFGTPFNAAVEPIPR
jgi:hypothetical protein